MKTNFNFSSSAVSFEKDTDYAFILFAQHKENVNCYFAVILLKENLYSSDKSYLKFNYITEWYEKCKYEAICEGDDYWIDSRKLQKQVDILDNDSNIGLVYSKAEAFTVNGKTFFVGRKVLDVYDLVKDNNIPTVTVNGQEGQMKSFVGSKAIGVNPNCKNPEVAVALADYLGSQECQQIRFDTRQIIPTNITR